jgi:hypothetical protein
MWLKRKMKIKVTAIRNLNEAEDGKLTPDMVKNSMLNGEAKRKEKGSHRTSSSDAYVAKKKDKNQGRSHKKPQRGRSKSRERSQSSPSDKIICFHCDKKGHKRNHCRVYKRELAQAKQGKKTEQKGEASVVIAAGEDYLIVDEDSCFSANSGDDLSWVVDLGASFHLASQREYFTSYTSGDFSYVRMGNRDMSTIVGKGTACVEISIGCKLTLENVRHVPDIRLNLLSVGKLDDTGLGSYFGEGKWKLTKGSLILARGAKQGCLYFNKDKVVQD